MRKRHLSNPVGLAILRKDSKGLRKALARNPADTAWGLGGERPLLLACRLGFFRGVRILLSNGAVPDRLPTDEVSPLALSVASGCALCVRLLLKSGAVPSGRPSSEPTLSQLAAFCFAATENPVFCSVISELFKWRVDFLSPPDNSYPGALSLLASKPMVWHMFLSVCPFGERKRIEAVGPVGTHGTSKFDVGCGSV